MPPLQWKGEIMNKNEYHDIRESLKMVLDKYHSDFVVTSILEQLDDAVGNNMHFTELCGENYHHMDCSCGLSETRKKMGDGW